MVPVVAGCAKIDVLLFGVLGALFVSTAGPATQPFRDAGEFVAASQALSIAHPPGYALYTLAGRIWDAVLPWGASAYRLNVLSAFLMVFAAVGLRGALRAWDVPSLLAAGVAALAILSRPSWITATVSEPYALMTALSAAALWAGAAGRAAPAWLLTGLAICVHPMVIALIPVIVVITLKNNAPRNPQRQALLLAFLLLGLAPCLVLPIRAKADPALNWGRTETLTGLVQHLTRAEYRGLLLTETRPVPPRENSLGVLRRFAREFASDLTPPVAAAAVAGVALAVRWFPRPGWGLAVGFLLAGPGYALAAALPDDPLSQATLLPGRILPLLFALLASGLALSRLQARVLPVMVGGALASLLIYNHAPQMNRRWNFAAHDWAASLLRGVERDGIALLAGDRNLFPVWAAQAGGARRDVDIVSPLLSRDWEVERLARRRLLPQQSTVVTAMQDLVDRARDRRPVFVKHTVGALTRLDGAVSPTLAQLRQRTAVRLPRPAAQDPYDRQIAEAMRW